MRVYVSSTYEDLKAYREEVWRQILGLGYQPVCMEFMGSRPVRPVVACLQDVAECDVYVGFLGRRYGYVDTEYPGGDGRSITELEYCQAVEAGKTTLVYLLDEAVLPPPEPEEPEESVRRLGALRDKWRRSLCAVIVDSPLRLALQVSTDFLHLATRDLPGVYGRSREATPEQERTKQEDVERIREEMRQASKLRRDANVPVVGTQIRESVLDHFRDRVVQLHQLREHLADPRLRVILVWGRGGVGKTTLVTKLVHELQWRLADKEGGTPAESIVYLELRDAQYHSPDSIVEMIARTLGPEEGDELRARWRAKNSLAEGLGYLFHEVLAEHRCLIVLDNLEDVLDEENHVKAELSDLRKFLEAALDYDHEAVVLATSRRKLLLSPDVQVRTLRRRREVCLDEGLPEDEAIELLRTLDEDGAAGTAQTPKAVLGEIVRRCEGNPRTLETIIGHVQSTPSLTFESLLADEESFTRLVGNPARELFEGLPSDQQRLVMQVLAVFNHPVPAAAVRYVVPGLPVDEILDELTRKYAVSYDDRLFSLHPLDQQYAYSQIPEAGDEYSREVLHRLAGEYYDELRKPASEWRTIEDLEPHLQRFHHLVRGGLPEAASSLLGAIDHSYLQKWGYANVVIELRRELVGKLSPGRLDFDNLVMLGHAYLEVARLSEGLVCEQDAERIAREMDDLGLLQIALNGLGLAYADAGQPDDAERCLRENLGYAERAGDKTRMATALANLGAVMIDAGRPAEAVEMLEEALEIDRLYLTDREVGIDFGGLGFARWMLGQTPEAVDLHRQAYDLAVGCGDRVREAIHKGNEARALMEIGQVEVAQDLFVEAIEITRSTCDGRRLTLNLADFGRLLAWRGDDAEAAAHIDEALKQANLIPYPRAQIRGQVARGWRLLIAGDALRAAEAFATACDVARQVSDRFWLCKALRGLAHANHLGGQLPEAAATCAEGAALDFPTDCFAVSVRQGLAATAMDDGQNAAAQFDLGARLCQAQLERTPRYFDARFHLTLAQLGLGRPAEALESCRQALEVCRAPGFLGLVLKDLEMLQSLPEPIFGVRETIDLLRAALG